MNPGRRHATLVLLAMLGTAAAGQALRPTQRLSEQLGAIDLEAVFPRQFGDWRVDLSVPVQLVSPDLQQFLAKIYNATLSRVYVDGLGRRVMLSVAYGGDQSDATRAHRPEVCYPAQGFQIVADGQARVDTAAGALRVRTLVAETGSRVEPITYWVVVGTHAALSGTEQKLAQLRYGTRGIVPDGMLVRVSSIGRDVAGGHRLQAGFITALSHAVAPAVRARIIGDQEG